MTTVDTIPGAARATAARLPDKVALIEGGESWTFAELYRDARAVASAYLARGIGKGDVVAIWAPNRREWILAGLGAHIAGAAITPLNTRMKGMEAGDILRRSYAKLLVCTERFMGFDYPTMIAGEDLPDLAGIVRIDGEGADGWAAFIASGKGADDPAVDAAEAAVAPDDLSDIMFTSGTTGSPKGVLHSHGNVVPLFRAWAERVDLQESDRYLIANPFFHTFGYKAGWVACLALGVTMLPMAVFDVNEMARLIETERVSFIPGPPTIYQSLLQGLAGEKRDFSSMRVAVTGAAPVPPVLVERMRRELGMENVVNGYGMTEFGAIAMTGKTDSPETVANTCGYALPGVEMTCVDGAGRPVAAGETGEILVRGRGRMIGYFENPEATGEAIDADGWLHTGDVGSIDADGYLRITDRKKDMFISGGFNCYPAEIEKLLAAHPAIELAAVIGVPDERMGEVGKAFVVLRPGTHADAAGIIAWSRENMANYKAPRSIEFVDELPRNAGGKVLRTALRER
ncbi:FadD3 family acyl-CoA ligase [Sphingomonas jatrophae]|uniref:Acyl-CoA synthetase (AMP-forming)/AMP-acid ligase II n=1 Tax=Sphingomonas jatrophae TaxID=1166337 RepID=A0A1I6KL96_9SPHN|nr:FadD3 family acyl-CoA ligase [Sphingomonas jatrophae]SFR91976.1 Acyl-CoA synthetase (AMP-forming)/AMP-acid ligase II [Sphingomonas jatrophae]